MQAPSLQNYVSQILIANAVVQTTATPRNLTSLALSAGIWELSASVIWITAGTTVVISLSSAFNLVTATMGTADTSLVNLQNAAAGITPTAANPTTQAIPPFQYNLTAATTIFLNTNAVFTTAALTVAGIMTAVQISP